MGQVRTRFHRSIHKFGRFNSNSTHSKFSGKFVQQDIIRQGTVTTIKNLTNATVAGREVIARVINIVSNLTVGLAEVNTKLVKTLADNANLTTKLADRQISIPCPPPRNVIYTHY